MKTVKHYPLSLLLSDFGYFDESLNSFRAVANLLGDDSEILSDALHLLIREGNFGCFDDGVKAILWAMFLDSKGKNYLHEEFDSLRNGDALKYLLQNLEFESPLEHIAAELSREVTGNE